MTTYLTQTRIGPFSVGEKPKPLEITFLDDQGAAINLTGYTAKFQIVSVEPSGIAGLGIGTSIVSDPAGGKTTYTWNANDFLTAGMYRGQMWVGNATFRMASVLFEWFVRIGTSAPSI